MDYLQMTAPCGLDCFNCSMYLAPTEPEHMKQMQGWAQQFGVPVEKMLCKGCKNQNGIIPVLELLFGEDHKCATYECSKQKNLDFCCDCEDFPCDNLHPYKDKADELPHNFKVFNLCLIKKMGLENWGKNKASQVRQDYFTKPWSLK